LTKIIFTRKPNKFQGKRNLPNFVGFFMRINLYGLTLETPGVTFYLWSPWRAAALEHRLFEVISQLPKMQAEQAADERRIHVTDPKTLRNALGAMDRVLKGWQEEAELGGDRRTWHWLLEGDTDGDGFDHTGEPFTLWGFLRLTVDHGGPDEPEKEHIDLEGFGFRIWGERTVSGRPPAE
jgi:hypothetical protein